MKLIWAHFKAGTLQLMRLPGYTIPTVIFPGMLFLFFGVAEARGRMAANFIMAGYSVFAVMGVTFYQFGAGIAQERGSPWEGFLRILPVSPQVRFAARVLSALVFALAAVGVVVVIAHLLTPVGLETSGWLRFSLGLLLGGIPFALFGIALGYWASPRAAIPFANLFNLPLAYAGGLWVPPQRLPEMVATLSPYLPSRRYNEVIWTAVLGQAWHVDDWLWLLGYTVVFGLLAFWGYQRDEGQRYR